MYGSLDYLDAYGGDPSAVLAPLRPYGVKLPDDSRIRPSVEVARQIEREEAALRDAGAEWY